MSNVRTQIDPSLFTEPGAAMDLYHKSIRAALPYDAFGGKTRFLANVISTPIKVASGGTTGDNWSFRARIIEDPSPHWFIPNPCNEATAGNDKENQKLIALHTSFVGAGAISPTYGDMVIVELERNTFSYNLQHGKFIRVVNNPAAAPEYQWTSCIGNCERLAETFDEMPEPTEEEAPELVPVDATELQIQTAKNIGIEVAILQAIVKVESSGQPAAIRFEPHVFLRKKPKYADEISYTPKDKAKNQMWSIKATETGKSAFTKAESVDAATAIASTSWGLYQVMGHHLLELFEGDAAKAKAEFYKDPTTISYRLLESWFKENPKAVTYAKSKDWKKFTKTYNGPANVAVYAPKLEGAYALVTGGAKSSPGGA